LWAIGDVTGLLAFTHVGKYQGDIVAANLLGEPRDAHYDAVPRVTYTDPQAAAVGATEGRFSATAAVSDAAKTATYTRAYAESNGFLTRARVPLDVLRDTIQPFPTFSEIYVAALTALRDEMSAAREPVAAGHVS
jgi:hypothetical protein